VGNTEIEDSVQKLDKLTQEEARMAAAEQMVIMGNIRNNVQGVGDKVEDVGNKVQGIDHKLEQVNRKSLYHPALSTHSDILTSGQLRDSLFRWLSPSDPSTNHNTTSKAHHDGTAQWFIQGTIFNQWKSTDKFLWIHGIRASPLSFIIS
jgi:hypothetical protein